MRIAVFILVAIAAAVSFTAAGQPAFDRKNVFRPLSGSSLNNVQLLRQSADGTEALVAVDYGYDGTGGPTAKLSLAVEKKDQKGVSAWFGADSVTVPLGHGIISLRIKYFVDEPGVPAQFTTDRLRILLYNSGGEAILINRPFLKTIHWGKPGGTTLGGTPQIQPLGHAMSAQAAKEVSQDTAARKAAELATVEAEQRRQAEAKRLAQEKAEADAAERERALSKAQEEAKALAAQKRIAEEKMQEEARAHELARQQAAREEQARREAEAKAQEQERLKLEAQNQEIARQKAAEEAKARAEAQAREQKRLQAEAEAKAHQEAETKARSEAEAREAARVLAEAKARQLFEENRAAREKAKEETEAAEAARRKAETDAQRLADEQRRALQKAQETSEAATLKTRITSFDVIKRSLDRSQMIFGIEFEFQDQATFKAPQLGVMVDQAAEPKSGQYFVSQPIEIGRSKRNIAMVSVSFQPSSAGPSTGFTTDQLMIYLQEAGAPKRYVLMTYSKQLVWNTPAREP